MSSELPEKSEPAIPVAIATAPFVPPGAPPGGQMVEIKYCGMISWLICLVFFCPCAQCCPCDKKELYKAPNGQLYTATGAIAEKPLFAQGL